MVEQELDKKEVFLCPKCLEKMVVEIKRNVEIHSCPKCNVILIENQEFDEIFKNYKSSFNRDYVKR